MATVPEITERVEEAVGSVHEAIRILGGDDSPESLALIAKYRSLSEYDQKAVRLEDLVIASGLTSRRFMEILAGAVFERHGEIDKLFVATSQIKVLRQAVKAATSEQPILDATGEVVGTTNGDVKAMELFLKGSGFIPTPKPSIYAPQTTNNTQINVDTTAAERQPLQSMDSWLLEIDDIRKPRQLTAPKPVEIPVEMPENAPEVEYLSIEGN